MIVTSELLADVVCQLMKAGGVANGNVDGVRAWPLQPEQLPHAQLVLPEEKKRRIGGRITGLQFNVLATLPIVFTVQAPADVDEAGAAAARAELLALQRKFETTVLGAPALMSLIQSITFVDTQARVDGRGEFIAGQSVVMLGLEFYQGPEAFYVPQLVPLAEVDVFDRNADGTAGEERLSLVFEQDPTTGSGALDFSDPDESGLAAAV